MVLNFLRASRVFRALVLTALIGGLLMWLYIVARVVVNGVDVHWPFVDSVPAISVSAMGAFSFGLFCVSLFVYLALWGRFDRRRSAPGSTNGREPQ